MTQHPSAPLSPPVVSAGLPSTEAGQRSRLAVASLILGLSGFVTFVTAVIGLILGIVALVKINRSRGAQRGTPLAAAGVAVSALAMVVVPIVALYAALMVPIMTTAVSSVHEAQDTQRLMVLVQSVREYAAERGGELPPTDDWLEVLDRAGLRASSYAFSMSDPSAGRAYAMNARLEGGRLGDVRDPSNTILFFEVGPGAPMAGGPELLPEEPRYESGYVVVTVDGEVQLVDASEISLLGWDP
jgi:hypothetical protein